MLQRAPEVRMGDLSQMRRSTATQGTVLPHPKLWISAYRLISSVAGRFGRARRHRATPQVNSSADIGARTEKHGPNASLQRLGGLSNSALLARNWRNPSANSFSYGTLVSNGSGMRFAQTFRGGLGWAWVGVQSCFGLWLCRAFFAPTLLTLLPSAPCVRLCVRLFLCLLCFLGLLRRPFSSAPSSTHAQRAPRARGAIRRGAWLQRATCFAQHATQDSGPAVAAERSSERRVARREPLEQTPPSQDQSAFPHVGDVFRQCALMLTEVALDAAAYLPEASVPRPVWEGAAPGAAASSSAAAPGAASLPRELPRPLQAADAAHEGVRRLCRWSCALWSAGASACRGSTMYWELGLLCGALLVSVPQETAATRSGEQQATLPRGGQERDRP